MDRRYEPGFCLQCDLSIASPRIFCMVVSRSCSKINSGVSLFLKTLQVGREAMLGPMKLNQPPMQVGLYFVNIRSAPVGVSGVR